MKALVALLALLLIPGCGQLRLSPRHSSRTLARAVDATVTLSGPEGDVFCAGVIMQGYVVTAEHCVSHGMPFYVQKQGGQRLVGQVMRTWPAQDLALVATFVDLGKGISLATSAPGYGAAIALVGHPRGRFEYTVTRGYVAHPKREDPADTPSVWMQHDAAQSGGNSGGPVVDMRGRLVGIVSFGLIIEAHCLFACPGVYQDSRIKGAVHWESIKTFIENQSPESETVYPQ